MKKEVIRVKAVFLIGFMGCGKTTVGRMLGERLCLPVIDTDEEIVRRANETIPAIFERYGEAYFRHLETECLQSIPTENTIITTGGGIVTRKQNINWMKEKGIVIYLKCDLDCLFSRIQQDANRPLANMKPKGEIRTLFEKRKSQYEEAHICIDTTNLSPDQVVGEIVRSIKSMESGDNSF